MTVDLGKPLACTGGVASTPRQRVRNETPEGGARGAKGVAVARVPFFQFYERPDGVWGGLEGGLDDVGDDEGEDVSQLGGEEMESRFALKQREGGV